MASELTTDRIYYLSDYGKPLSHCVTSVGEIVKLVFEINPTASSIAISYLDTIEEVGEVTFYDYKEDCDITYQIESLKLIV